MKNHSAKRVNIVSLKLVKESSMLYKNRCVRSQKMAINWKHGDGSRVSLVFTN